MQYANSLLNVEVIQTGTFLDKLTGIGGIPRGRITEIFGEAGLGKSSISLQAIATAQQDGYKCLFADVEWAYDARYAGMLGVDNAKLGLVREQFAEDVLDILEEEINKNGWDLVVLDSIGGLLPRAEAEKDAGGKTIGSQASLVARFCRKLVPILALRNCALIVLNHSFTDIMSGKVKSSGGQKLDFHKSISIRLKPKYGTVLKVGDKIVGKVITGQVKKNKLASTEGLELDARIIFGEGFSKTADLLQDALDAGIFEKRGNTFYFENEKLGMISKVRELMKDESFSDKIKQALV